MKQEVIQFFRCPACAGELRPNTRENFLVGSDAATELQCSKCHAIFAIVEGIPRFVSESNYTRSFGYQWNLHRKTQLDSHTGMSFSRERLFRVTGWTENLTGQNILEAGSGAGRFTEVLVQTGANIFSFDYSLAVEANRANNATATNLCLFQANIFQIPVHPKSFDKVLCLGVLQHTPDPQKAFFSLARCVKPGGELVIDVYAKRLTALFSWKYLLRPIVKRIDERVLHSVVEQVVDWLLPLAVWLRRRAGRVGARLLPIVEYSHLGLPSKLNREWAILDTFDMYSPAHDHPQTLRTVRRWFLEAGFEDVSVADGPNGIVGRGRLPVSFGGNA